CHPGGTSGRPGSGNVRPVGSDAFARGTDERSPGRIGRVAPVGGTEPRALGPAGNSGRIGVVGQIRARRQLFPVPRGGRDRGGALPRPLVSGDSLGQSGGVLLVAGTDRTLRDSQTEPRSSGCRVARSRRRTRRSQGFRT